MELTNWFKAALNLNSGSGKNPKKQSKSALAADQRDLAVKLKNSFSALESELAEISGLIQAAEDGDMQAAEKIRSRQAHLRNLMGRVRAGFARTADLDRESAEWRSLLSSGGVDPVQLARLEILASELELRGMKRPMTSNVEYRISNIECPTSDPEPRDASYKLQVTSDIEDEGCVVMEVDQSSHDEESANHLEMMPETLLAGIKHASRELAKCQAVQDFDDDFLHAVHELRTLHAALKVLDRKNGFCRDRIAATDGFERIF